jgi:hypothetical protein
MKKKPQTVTEYLSAQGKKGGKARAKKHSKAQLSAWAKLGGRPRKDAKRGRNQMVFKGFKNKQQERDAVADDGMQSVAVTIIKDAPAEKKPVVRNQMVYKNKQRLIDEAASQAQAKLVKP